MTAVRLENITRKFRREDNPRDFFYAAKDVSFSIESGSLTVIGGANGSGKSVLMNIISGLMKPSSGKLTVESKPGLVFQDAATQILGETPREDVEVSVKNIKTPKAQVKAETENALKAVSLLEKADFPAEFLSGGEKRRLAVAAILAMKRNIIIFDEPYANLDYPGVTDVNRLISELHSQGKTIIILTHEIEKCLAISDHFIILRNGSLVFDGTPQQALELDLTFWGIRNPLRKYNTLEDLVWL
ncbi:MAG: ABC transporter ATP-binding protein [Treponema sp.]|nr:ABC transporter ATP-binding protein [Treponema sp.]